MLVRTSLNDSQVMYWEPAKYVARLRASAPTARPLLFKINMEAGHGGASGRYDSLREIAFDYAFILTAAGPGRRGARGGRGGGRGRGAAAGARPGWRKGGDLIVPLLPALERAEVAPELRDLWDECARSYPAFRHLWATMAHSPIVFRHVWGQLLELRRRSPVAARHFEIAIVVTSSLNRCRYCVSHHAPLAEAAGLAGDQVAYLAGLRLSPLPADHAFPPRPGFSREDGLVVDLAAFLVWSGIGAAAGDVHPRVVHSLRRRLFGLLAEHFSRQQIEELTWRTAQCVAFNWHNDFLELDLEPEVAVREPHLPRRPPARLLTRGAARRGATRPLTVPASRSLSPLGRG